MRDKLYVILEYKKLIKEYRDFDLKYSRKYYYLKDLLEKELFSNLKLLYSINSSTNISYRVSNKELMLGNIRYLNYLFESVKEVNIISDKQYKILFIRVESVYKYLNGWLLSERSNK